MRILLVHPKFPATYWGFQYSLAIVGKRATLPPLGLISLAALLPKEWELRLVDMNLHPLMDRDVLWSDAVLVGGMLVQAPSMHQVIARAGALGRTTVVGGPACTTSPALFAKADHLFLGEAEGGVGAIVEALERPESAPHVIRAKPDTRPAMEGAPVPRFDLLDVAQYRSMSLQYSRGCPYSCEFCDIVELFGRVPRVKSADQVILELEAIYALGYRGQLFFVDDNFIGNKREVMTLLPEVSRWQSAHGYPFALYTEASVNLAADARLLGAMVAAGFNSVFLGIESSSDTALEKARKTQNVGVDLARAVDTITGAGIEVMGGFIVGFDTDDPSTFEAQREFISSLPVPLAMVGMLTALPGTALWRRLESEGRLRPGSTGDVFDRPNFEPVMGDDALLHGYAALLRDLYAKDGYFGRARRLIDRVGPATHDTELNMEDIMITARAVLHLGILGERRKDFWLLLARGLRRGAYGVRFAITHAIMAEHMIRYTEEDVLPRVELALANLKSLRTAPASTPPTPVASVRPRHLRVLADVATA